MTSALLLAAVVWLPPETFTQWQSVDALLRSRPEVKATIALTPAMATPQARQALSPWIAAQRVEIAARIHGDPLLPLVAAHPLAPRPDDALERAAEARQAVERGLGIKGVGFVPGTGALDASLIGPLGACGSPWILAGRYAAADSPWAGQGRAAFVPAQTPNEAPLAPGAYAVDASTSPEEALQFSRATISEMLKALPPGRRPAEEIAAWPDWAGQTQSSSAFSAWTEYGEAARALARYQNSGAADLKVLEDATELLRKAQDARFFKSSAVAPEFRDFLLAVYKRIKAPAPESLYAVDNSSSAAAGTEMPTGVKPSFGPDWLAFDNPAASIAQAPDDAPNSDPWRLRGLRVEWNDERVLFRIFPSRVETSSGAPHPTYDVYMDLNHLVGAGSIRLLEGRGAFAQARDAWEFALSVSPPVARLWRAGTGDSEEVSSLKADADSSRVEIDVAVPRELLRGNPARWGYIVLALGPDGARTYGLIAPVDLQKTVLEHPGTAPRVSAARLQPN